MRNQKYFEMISKFHDEIPENQMLNMILGAYNEIAELEKKLTYLENRIFAAAVKTEPDTIMNQEPPITGDTVAAVSEDK